MSVYVVVATDTKAMAHIFSVIAVEEELSLMPRHLMNRCRYVCLCISMFWKLKLSSLAATQTWPGAKLVKRCRLPQCRRIFQRGVGREPPEASCQLGFKDGRDGPDKMCSSRPTQSSRIGYRA